MRGIDQRLREALALDRALRKGGRSEVIDTLDKRPLYVFAHERENLCAIPIEHGIVRAGNGGDLLSPARGLFRDHLPKEWARRRGAVSELIPEGDGGHGGTIRIRSAFEKSDFERAAHLRGHLSNMTDNVIGYGELHYQRRPWLGSVGRGR